MWEEWNVLHLCLQRHPNTPVCAWCLLSLSNELRFLPSRGNADSCGKAKPIWIPNKIAELSLKIKILECQIQEVFWEKNLSLIWCHSIQLKGKVMQMSNWDEHAGSLAGIAVWGSQGRHCKSWVSVYSMRCICPSELSVAHLNRQPGGLQVPCGAGC